MNLCSIRALLRLIYALLRLVRGLLRLIRGLLRLIRGLLRLSAACFAVHGLFRFARPASRFLRPLLVLTLLVVGLGILLILITSGRIVSAGDWRPEQQNGCTNG